MAWKKKAGSAKPTTEFDVQCVRRSEANKFLTSKAAQKWFINSVSPDGSDRVLVVSCKKTYPPKKSDSETEKV